MFVTTKFTSEEANMGYRPSKILDGGKITDFLKNYRNPEELPRV